MRAKVITGIVLLCALLVAGGGQAEIIWDYSPATTAANADQIGGWTSKLSVQSFAESIRFVDPVQITGMDIYSFTRNSNWQNTNLPSVGDSVTIRLWSDALGHPATMLTKFTESISVIDSQGATLSNERVHVHFTTPLDLASGTTYWIGMCGTYTDLAQVGLTNPGAPGDSRMAQFNYGDDFQGMTSAVVGDMAFRLEGSAVPEPSTLVGLLGFGAVGLIAVWQRRRRRAG